MWCTITKNTNSKKYYILKALALMQGWVLEDDLADCYFLYIFFIFFYSSILTLLHQDIYFYSMIYLNLKRICDFLYTV